MHINNLLTPEHYWLFTAIILQERKCIWITV